MASSITAYNYSAERGTFTWLQSISTLPPDFGGDSATAEILVHPSGNFVSLESRSQYDRGLCHRPGDGYAEPDRLDPDTGTHSAGLHHRSVRALMLVGTQNSDNIVPFRISQRSGRLIPTGAVTQTPVPVSFAFGAVISRGEQLCSLADYRQ